MEDEVQKEIEDLKKRLARYEDLANALDNTLRNAGEWLARIIPDYDIDAEEVKKISDIMSNYLNLTRTWKVTVQAEWDVWITLPYDQVEDDIDAGEFSVDISSYYYDLIDTTENDIKITNCEER